MIMADVGPDYIFAISIEDFQYESKLGMDPATKKFGRVQSMSIRFRYRFTDCKTKAPVKVDEAVVRLTDKEIANAQAADEKADLVVLLMRKIAQELLPSIQP